jgi:hypothetical protein
VYINISLQVKSSDYGVRSKTGIFFPPQIAVLKTLRGNMHCHETKSTFPVTGLIFSTNALQYTLQNVFDWLTVCFGVTDSQWLVHFVQKPIPVSFVPSILNFILSSVSDTLDFPNF